MTSLYRGLSTDHLTIMRIIVAHTKSQREMIETVDRTFEDAFKGLALGPIEITDQRKSWRGSVMSFSLTAKMGFLKNPVSGTVEVSDRDIILTAELGGLAKLIPTDKIQPALKTRLKGLLT